MNEKQILLANILGGLNTYIRDLVDDEDIYYAWICYFPDECTEDELMEIAEDEALCADLIKMAGILIKESEEN